MHPYCVNNGKSVGKRRKLARGGAATAEPVPSKRGYGPVTDNAQSVYELSLIENVPNVVAEVKNDFNVDVNFGRAKHLLEENDGAGNTFKATAKPVLIGTAVVGATTMIFSIIMALTNGLTSNTESLSLLHAPFVLGLITGGAVIY